MKENFCLFNLRLWFHQRLRKSNGLFKIYPKGQSQLDSVDASLGTWDLHGDDYMAQFQIETAYRVKGSIVPGRGPLDMANSRSLSSFHSSMFKQFSYYRLGDSYQVGTVEDRAVDGFLTLEFEIRTYLAPKMKFQFSCDKQAF